MAVGLFIVATVSNAFQIAAKAQVGTCSPALAEAYLDVGNVRARILNNGGLFWRGDPFVYEVPKGGGVNAMFAGGFWIGGKVNGELRVAAARYSNYEFWAGPIDDAGNAPADCSAFDRIWSVYRSDVEAYELGEAASADLAEWPTGLGAPTLAPAAADGVDNDGDGTVDEAGEMKRIHDEILQLPLSQRADRVIDLDAGERPELVGDQMLWWIMNDVGNEHRETGTPPIGLEVHAAAFAFDRPDRVRNGTFYHNRLFLRSSGVLDEAYIGLFSDADLGDFQDDFVGTDTTLGIGFVYNSDNYDTDGYLENPPALGHVLLQGPVVSADGDTARALARLLPGYRNLGMTAFVKYENGRGFNEDPTRGIHYYNYMRGVWKDGRPIKASGDGFNVDDPSVPVTTIMFPGDPVTGQHWSEFTGGNEMVQPGDRRYVLGSGPFRLEPGKPQEIVYGIVWARGDSYLDSITHLRWAAQGTRAWVDANFQLPEPPDVPDITLTPLDGRVIIEWTNPPTSNNYLDGYREHNLLANPEDPYFEFEGYEIRMFADGSDVEGTVIATYDLANGILNVVEDRNEDGIAEVTANGADTGIRHTHVVQDLQNYVTYHFGVRAYGYNATSTPKAYFSDIVRASAAPAPTALLLSDDALEAFEDDQDPDFAAAQTAGQSNGAVYADIVNPAAVRDAEYRVAFYGTPVTYDVLRDDDRIVDGSASGNPAPQVRNAFVVDGLEFSIVPSQTGIRNFLTTANASGPLDPPDMGTFSFDNGFPVWEEAPAPDDDRPTAGYQQATTDAVWGINVGGGDGTFEDYLERSLRNENLSRLGSHDYEIRFDGGANLSVRAFEDGAFVDVPFTLWRIGVGTSDNPSDDVRMVAVICESLCGGGADNHLFDTGGDHPVSGGDDDPATDWIYWYATDDQTPGSTGHDRYFAGDPDVNISEVLARMVLVNLDGGSSPPYSAALPEEGTVFRIVTSKPMRTGDEFAFSTDGYGASEPDLETQQERLNQIGIVPNPYGGVSDYAVSLTDDAVVFTSMPEVATIRVFTLHGTLVRTLEKNDSSRSLTWDVRNEAGRRLASGMYLIHVEVPGVGDAIIKFGMTKKRLIEG